MNGDLEKRSIGCLPNEILLAIFSHLSCEDVRYGVAKVCVRWSILARDTRLWRNLKFKTTNQSAKTFGSAGSWYSTLKFLENTPELQRVIVSHGHSDREILEILGRLNAHCRHLCHIEFEADLGRAARHLTRLENLLSTVESLKLNLVSCHSRSNLFKILPAFKNLRRVALKGANPDLSPFEIFLRDCSRLESLDLSEVTRFSKGNFMSLWKNRTKFLGLAVKADKLDETCLKLLSTFPNLKDLVLSDGNSRPEKLDRVGRLLPLKRLLLQEDASSPVLTSSTLTEFFRRTIFSHLKELKLYKSRLDDDGAAEIRRNCPNLIYLEVMTYPRCLSSLSEKALVHFLHCRRLQRFEILFDKSEEADWLYRRKRHVNHECEVDGVCPMGLQALLSLWDEIQIPVD